MSHFLHFLLGRRHGRPGRPFATAFGNSSLQFLFPTPFSNSFFCFSLSFVLSFSLSLSLSLSLCLTLALAFSVLDVAPLCPHRDANAVVRLQSTSANSIAKSHSNIHKGVYANTSLQ